MDPTFRFSVCPHDTAKNLLGWFLLNTYLQRKLGCAVHFEPCGSFNDERGNVLSGDYQLVYTNPFSALLFQSELNFVPIAKPIGLYDETLVVSRADAKLPCGKIKIAAATDQLIVYDLGVALLDRLDLSRERCEFDFVGTHLRAVQAVAEGTHDLGFVFNETWSGLTEYTRRKLCVIAESSSQEAYHCFCIAPEWLERREQLQQILCGMSNDSQGIQVLNDLHLLGFESLPANALDALSALVRKFQVT